MAGWDTMDEIKANSLGWRSKSFEELHLIHFRETGKADGFWKALVKYGRANYVCGYHPIFMIAKCMKRLLERPVVVGSLVIFYSYFSCYLRKEPQIDEPVAIAYLRKQQIARLLGKPSLWK